MARRMRGGNPPEPERPWLLAQGCFAMTHLRWGVARCRVPVSSRPCGGHEESCCEAPDRWCVRLWRIRRARVSGDCCCGGGSGGRGGPCCGDPRRHGTPLPCHRGPCLSGPPGSAGPPLACGTPTCGEGVPPAEDALSSRGRG